MRNFEKLVINEEEACNYIKFLLQNMALWNDITYKKDKESNVWVFSGYINYRNKPQKIIKIIDMPLFIKLLKIGFGAKKGISVNYIDFIDGKTSKFKIRYNLIDTYCRTRKR